MRARNWAAFMISVSAILLSPTSAQDSGPSQADWDWVSKHYLRVFDQLLPMQVPTGMYVSYRSHRDGHADTLEYSFFIGWESNKNGPGLAKSLSAHVRVADSLSIYGQMMAMHRQNPAESAASIEKRVKVKVSDLNEKSCPAIHSQFVKFQDLSFKPPEFEAFIVHPLVHEFHVVAGMGVMDFSLADDAHPLVRWAIETRKALNACVSSS